MKRIFFMALAGIVLAMPMMGQNDDDHYTRDWLGNGTYELPENVSATRVPQNLTEAIQLLPVMPKAEDLCFQASLSKAATTAASYKAAIEQASLNAIQNDALIRAKLEMARNNRAQQGQRAMQQYQSNVSAGLVPSQQEMMALYMSGEINEKMSEAQMMDVMAGKFAAKWGVSKEEYLKIIGLAQKNEKQAEAYIKSNHPQLYQRLYAANAGYDSHNETEDPRDDRFAEITSQIQAISSEEYNQVIMAYTGTGGIGGYEAGTYGVSYAQLLDQLQNEWQNSAEAKEIEAIETKLWSRVEEWIPTLHTTAGEFPYPAWWTADRKRENALIDQWNKRVAPRWLKIAQDAEKQIKAVFEKLAKLETENEQLGAQGAADNYIYLTNKQLLNNYMGQLIRLIHPYEDALRFPFIEHVEETGSAILGKG